MGSSKSAVALEIAVVSYGGEPLMVPTGWQLEGKSGLTIGRNTSNDVVLDDPARQISRFQAKVSKTSDGATLSNVSSQSSVLINGAEVKPGATASVQAGDKIIMGKYLLEMRASQTASPAAPDAHPQAEDAAIWSQPASAACNDMGMGQIPDDYDVFAMPRTAPSQMPDNQELSLEALSDAGSKALLQGLDPVQGCIQESVLGEQKQDKGAVLDLMDEKLDPMKLFGGSATEVIQETLALDHRPEVQRIIKLPQRAQTVATPPPEESVDPFGDIQAGSASNYPAETEENPFALLQAEAVTLAEEAEVEQPVIQQTSKPLQTGPVEANGPSTIQEQEQEQEQVPGSMREALAQGSGIPVDSLPELTPELMYELGMILRALSNGTVRLMHSRSITKHELRANVTIIASAGNNPLKFAPDGISALQQLLGKRFSGFMPPIEAIEDAFDDLSAHQLGLLAGARRAASDMIERLSPERTVASAEEPGMLEQLLPVVKEAKMWRRHKLRYNEIADDDEGFAALIEKSFVRSYEDEIERIYAGRKQ